MKKTYLILSILFYTGCKSADFPDELVTIVDIKNEVCRDYKLIDAKSVKFEGPVARYRLDDPKCESIIGYRPKAFKNIQNWIRDQQKTQDAQIGE